MNRAVVTRVAPPVHVVLSLLTLAPGQVGGSEAVLLGLLDEFRAGHGPERVTALAGERVARTYAAWLNTAKQLSMHSLGGVRSDRCISRGLLRTTSLVGGANAFELLVEGRLLFPPEDRN